MPLKAVVDTLDEVDTNYHGLYEEKDGKHVLKPIDGLKPVAEFNTVHGALTKERADHKKVKTQLTTITSSFGDRTPEQVLADLDRIPELEAAAEGKLDEAKIDGIVQKRVKAVIAPIERERDQFKNQVAEKDNEIQTYKGKDRQRAIQDTVTAAAKKAKLRDSAVDDAVVLAERHLDVLDDGSVVTRDNVAGIRAGLDVEAWLSDLQPKRPHWWEASSGGGGRPGEGAAFADNPWRAENWNMTKQGQIVNSDPQKAQRMAKAAGSSVGAIQPPAKK